MAEVGLAGKSILLHNRTLQGRPRPLYDKESIPIKTGSVVYCLDVNWNIPVTCERKSIECDPALRQQVLAEPTRWFRQKKLGERQEPRGISRNVFEGGSREL